MALLRSRTFAVVVLMVCVIGGTLLSAGRSLGALKEEADAAFYQGDGAIANDLAERAITAGNLVVVAKRYLSASNPFILAVDNACEQLRGAKGVRESYDANEALTDQVNALLAQLKAEQMSARDAQLWRSLPADMASRDTIIARSAYHQLAKEYNTVVSGFPAGALATVTGVGRAELYQ